MSLASMQAEPVEWLYQVIDKAGDVFDTFRNQALANRVAAAHGYEVFPVNLNEYRV